MNSPEMAPEAAAGGEGEGKGGKGWGIGSHSFLGKPFHGVNRFPANLRWT